MLAIQKVGGLLAVLLAAICAVTSWELSVSPAHQQVRPNGMAAAAVTVICDAGGVSLSECHFKMKYETSEGPVIVLTPGTRLGDASRALATHAYNGTGMEHGQCGMSISAVPSGSHVVGCRAKAATGGWRYQTATVFADDHTAILLTFTPSVLIAEPGQNLTLRCSTGDYERDCNITLASTYSWPGYGACGILTNALEEMSGPVWCRGWDQAGEAMGAAAISLVVAKPPTTPQLVLATPVLSPGAHLSATVHLQLGRPPANVSWYLGDRLMRQDGDDDGGHGDWHWPWSSPHVTQSVGWRVAVEDHGKEVAVVVRHHALEQPVVVKRRINVIPTCGRRISTRRRKTTGLGTRIMGADEQAVSGSGEFPWVAGVYRKQRDSSYNQECGGTLITPSIVVTAAQCVWHESRNRLHDRQLYRVALGKYHRDWSHVDAGEQRLEVAEIVVNQRYRGRQGRYAYDIAVLRLAGEAGLTRTVGVACVDWEGKTERLQLRTGSDGVVSGWGIDHTGTSSATLRTVTLPYVDEATCFEAIDEPVKRFLTADKFCAGYRERNVSVCPGDSGGGLVFRSDTGDDGYYLRGVVSIAFKPHANTDRCYADLYTGFTMVSAYLPWIKLLL